MDPLAWSYRWLSRSLNCHHVITDNCLKKVITPSYFCAVALFSCFELFYAHRQIIYVKYSCNVAEVLHHYKLSKFRFTVAKKVEGNCMLILPPNIAHCLTIFIYLFILRSHSGHHSRQFHSSCVPFYIFTFHSFKNDLLCNKMSVIQK